MATKAQEAFPCVLGKNDRIVVSVEESNEVDVAFYSGTRFIGSVMISDTDRERLAILLTES